MRLDLEQLETTLGDYVHTMFDLSPSVVVENYKSSCDFMIILKKNKNEFCITNDDGIITSLLGFICGSTNFSGDPADTLVVACKGTRIAVDRISPCYIDTEIKPVSSTIHTNGFKF